MQYPSHATREMVRSKELSMMSQTATRRLGMVLALDRIVGQLLQITKMRFYLARRGDEKVGMNGPVSGRKPPDMTEGLG